MKRVDEQADWWAQSPYYSFILCTLYKKVHNKTRICITRLSYL